jgi:hypothetical protein
MSSSSSLDSSDSSRSSSLGLSRYLLMWKLVKAMVNGITTLRNCGFPLNTPWIDPNRPFHRTKKFSTIILLRDRIWMKCFSSSITEIQSGSLVSALGIGWVKWRWRYQHVHIVWDEEEEALKRDVFSFASMLFEILVGQSVGTQYHHIMSLRSTRSMIANKQWFHRLFQPLWNA